MIKFIYTFIFIFSISSFAQLDERIHSFDVKIDPTKVGIIVEEMIHYQFPSNKAKRGIFRDIITDEKRTVEFFGIDLNYKIDLTVLSVKDELGRPYRYEVIDLPNGVRIKIGNPNIFVKGSKYYQIIYSVKNVIRHFDTHDEIYWNVTGNYWNYPIDKASLTVTKPEEAYTIANLHRAFSGRYGATKEETINDYDNNKIKTETQNLKAREGLSAVISFSKGYFTEKNNLEYYYYLLKQNIFMLIVVLLPVVVFGIMAILFYFKGRELYKIKSLVVKYSPPEGCSPAVAGVLLDDHIHPEDIISIFIDLSTRGYLHITEIEVKNLLWGNNKDYNITILDKKTDRLNEYELVFLNKIKSLARKEQSNSILMSELKNKFYVVIPKIKQEIFRSIEKSKFYSLSPEKVKKITATGSFILISGAIYSNFIHENSFLGMKMMLSAALSYFIIIIFTKYMPRKTKMGFEYYAHILGYKEFIERVEKADLERLVHKDPMLFERTLPFAIAMGLADKWAQKFIDISIDKPNWYTQSGHSRTFHHRAFITSLGSSMVSMQSSIASAPRSSGGSGSGGGGFSGGGSGGGGGGSW